jgi:hypothetical protein
MEVHHGEVYGVSGSRTLQGGDAAYRKETKSKVIELALRALVRQYRLAELRELAGSGLVNWTPEELSSWREIAKTKE